MEEWGQTLPSTVLPKLPLSMMMIPSGQLSCKAVPSQAISMSLFDPQMKRQKNIKENIPARNKAELSIQSVRTQYNGYVMKKLAIMEFLYLPIFPFYLVLTVHWIIIVIIIKIMVQIHIVSLRKYFIKLLGFSFLVIFITQYLYIP